MLIYWWLIGCNRLPVNWRYSSRTLCHYCRRLTRPSSLKQYPTSPPGIRGTFSTRNAVSKYGWTITVRDSAVNCRACVLIMRLDSTMPDLIPYVVFHRWHSRAPIPRVSLQEVFDISLLTFDDLWRHYTDQLGDAPTHDTLQLCLFSCRTLLTELMKKVSRTNRGNWAGHVLIARIYFFRLIRCTFTC